MMYVPHAVLAENKSIAVVWVLLDQKMGQQTQLLFGTKKLEP
jgi:hypothetical protein